MQSGLTLEEAIARAPELDGQRTASGFDQAALDDAAGPGFSNGAFEESGDDTQAVVEEFYPEAEGEAGKKLGNGSVGTSLKDKLERKAAAWAGVPA